MRVGIIGAGHIGGIVAAQLTKTSHDVVVSFSRDDQKLKELAERIGAVAGTPADAANADVVVLSVPWGVIDNALGQAGPLDDRIVIDTTNQFGRAGVEDLGGVTAARYNANRMPGARYTKSFNTLTAGFQAEVAGRTGDNQVVQWIAGDDLEAKKTVATLIDAAGFLPIDLAGIDDCQVMEAPRRPGAVYGEEYRRADAASVVEAVRAGRPIPPTPVYKTGEPGASAR